MTRFQYRVYGLILSANCPLEDLVPDAEHAAADLRVSFCGQEIGEHAPVPAPAWIARRDGFPLWTAATAEGTYRRLRYDGAGTFGEFIFDPTGSRVWVTWGDGVTLADLSAVLLGPVLGCVLRLRGVTCLHGSVVALAGRAVALLGAKGAGKSTTALSLAQSGGVPAAQIAVLSDDLAALVDEGDRFRVQTGYPQLRLTPQAATTLCGSYDGLRPLWSMAKERPQKRSLDVRQGEAWLRPEPIPLAALYLLGPRGQRAPFASAGGTAAAASTPLPPDRALMGLMAHRYVDFMLDRAGHERDFERLGRLVSRVPVRWVERPEGLDRLSEVAEAILSDARTVL